MTTINASTTAADLSDPTAIAHLADEVRRIDILVRVLARNAEAGETVGPRWHDHCREQTSGALFVPTRRDVGRTA
jgi:hypothetical protein